MWITLHKEGVDMGRVVTAIFSLMLFAVGCAADGAGSVASQKFESAVVVEIGYKLNPITHVFEFKYGRWTLFSDGTVYSSLPPAALDAFDLQASRKSAPQAWGKWRNEGGALVVTWDGQNETKSFKKWFRLETLPAGSQLQGNYTVLDTSSSLGADSKTFFATGWQVVGFGRDGRFEKVKGGSVDSNQRDTEVSTGHTEEEAGTYRIDGPLLEMRFRSGRVERASLFLSSKDAKTIFINGVQLTRR
jgi:hypothetical protein